jgi:pre-mRNA branch site protein p14
MSLTNTRNSQIRQGIANNTKGTAFVVYEDVMDAKQACDKLNGFNFQNRYLVGTHSPYPH